MQDCSIATREDLRLRLPGTRPAKDLFLGLDPQGLPLPRNVVVFGRNHISGLLAGAAATPQHRRHVLICCLETAGTVSVDGRLVRLVPGQALMVLPFQVHYYLDLEGRLLRWLFVTFEVDGGACEGFRFRRMNPDGASWSHWAEIYRMWEYGYSGICYSMGLLLTSLQRSEGEVVAGAGVDDGGAAGKESLSIVGRVSQTVFRADGQILTSGEVARQLGLSEGYLRNVFKRKTGMSLGAHLQSIRLNRASALLSSTELRVGEIADRCGYESVYSFSRAFRSFAGVSPREFRKRGLAG